MLEQKLFSHHINFSNTPLVCAQQWRGLSVLSGKWSIIVKSGMTYFRERNIAVQKRNSDVM
jgi:hypothetical protein